eukprot:3221929-Pleurochrysis_carterae.AAC.3
MGASELLASHPKSQLARRSAQRPADAHGRARASKVRQRHIDRVGGYKRARLTARSRGRSCTRYSRDKTNEHAMCTTSI